VTLDGEVINDPTHNWAPQHGSWNNGAMDQWVATHLKADGPEKGPVVMGYYTREDTPTHHALADAFTICDHYFSSVMGPTNPNRLFWMTGGIDPDGGRRGTSPQHVARPAGRHLLLANLPGTARRSGGQLEDLPVRGNFRPGDAARRGRRGNPEGPGHPDR
jgi:hypothetical protein